MVESVVENSMIRKAVNNGVLDIHIVNPRDFSKGNYQQIDDTPFGGGPGMVMMAEPIVKTLKQINKKNLGRVIFMSPQGKKLNQKKIISLSKLKNMTIICGRYEGIDQRIIDKYVDEEISIGDFILSGGEYAAICLVDAISRYIPGTLGNKDSYLKDTFSDGLLKGDVFTKPEIFESMKVPDVLLSGNHKKIETWRSEISFIRTLMKRPDLLDGIKLTKKQKKLLEEWRSKAIL